MQQEAPAPLGPVQNTAAVNAKPSAEVWAQKFRCGWIGLRPTVVTGFAVGCGSHGPWLSLGTGRAGRVPKVHTGPDMKHLCFAQCPSVHTDLGQQASRVSSGWMLAATPWQTLAVAH